THEDVTDAAVGEQLVIDRQDRAAGIAEYEFDPLPREAIAQNRCAALLGHFHHSSSGPLGPPQKSTRHERVAPGRFSTKYEALLGDRMYRVNHYSCNNDTKIAST